MVENGLMKKVGLFELFLNRLSSSKLKDRQLNFIFLSNVAWQFFTKRLFIFDVISESEDNKGVPSFIVTLYDDLVLLYIPFLNIASG